MRRRADGAAGGEQIVDDEHAIARRQCVVVDLERVAAVLEDVFVTAARIREFVRLADRNETGAEVLRDDAAEDEAARLDRRDGGDAGVAERLRQKFARLPERLGGSKKGSDVFEDDARLRKIGDVADVARQLFLLHQNFTSKSGRRPLNSFDSLSI